MALTTSLAGRVRNTSLPKAHSLLPLLEAIVNGIQAVDARFGDDISQGRLRVSIRRSDQEEFDFGSVGPGRVALKPIVGFVVEDNGVGFTDENMASFETLDSDYKAGIGCRGVGRLLWLKAFSRVSVGSAYRDEAGDLCSRQFRFSVEREVEHGDPPDGFSDTGSVVHLDGFKEGFQKSAPKGVDAIAKEIFEHCIWYFLRPGGAPEIVVVDEEEVSLNSLFEDFVFTGLPTTSVEVKGKRFDMVNLCLKSSTRSPSPRLLWCASNRVVVEETLARKVPGLHGRLKDEDGAEFTYVCYLSSDFLDAHVRADRTAFDLPERIAGDTFDGDVSLDEIRAAVVVQVEKVLAGPLAGARGEGRERVNSFVSNRAPRYRPVLARLESLDVTVDPSMSDQELEMLLHRSLRNLEADAIAEGHAVVADAGSVPLEEYRERLTAYLDKITDINQSDLAAYVARRKAILDLLAKLIRSDEDGKYSREEAVHSLLMPMRTDSNEVTSDASNLWIIDERLAFHEYLASDKTLRSMPITGSESATEPDLLATKLIGEPILASEGSTLPLASIVVVEIKRPMRNDMKEDKDPILQVLEYVKRVRKGGVRTATGRPIPESQNVPAYCYVIADLTPTMVSRCEHVGLERTQDGLGYFGFNRAANAYIEVISFDQLLNAATQRNRAFFEKLGLPAT